jgi:hypothetical protein
MIETTFRCDGRNCGCVLTQPLDCTPSELFSGTKTPPGWLLRRVAESTTGDDTFDGAASLRSFMYCPACVAGGEPPAVPFDPGICLALAKRATSERPAAHQVS